jgi:Protein of unknown function (DUF2510)
VLATDSGPGDEEVSAIAVAVPRLRILGRLGHARTAAADFRFAPAGPISSSRTDTTPSAGWYPNLNNPATFRCWDGKGFTGDIRTRDPSKPRITTPKEPGWHPDPENTQYERYWDGTKFTGAPRSAAAKASQCVGTINGQQQFASVTDDGHEIFEQRISVNGG